MCIVDQQTPIQPAVSIENQLPVHFSILLARDSGNIVVIPIPEQDTMFIFLIFRANSKWYYYLSATYIVILKSLRRTMSSPSKQIQDEKVLLHHVLYEMSK